MTYNTKPHRKLTADTENCFRRWCIKVTESRHFETTIIICIILNTIVMALIWFDQPSDMVTVLEIINYTFSGIFTLEAIIKIVALRSDYFRDSWNIFDFIIVVFTLLIQALKLFSVNI